MLSRKMELALRMAFPSRIVSAEELAILKDHEGGEVEVIIPTKMGIKVLFKNGEIKDGVILKRKRLFRKPVFSIFVGREKLKRNSSQPERAPYIKPTEAEKAAVSLWATQKGIKVLLLEKEKALVSIKGVPVYGEILFRDSPGGKEVAEFRYYRNGEIRKVSGEKRKEKSPEDYIKEAEGLMEELQDVYIAAYNETVEKGSSVFRLSEIEDFEECYNTRNYLEAFEKVLKKTFDKVKMLPNGDFKVYLEEA